MPAQVIIIMGSKGDLPHAQAVAKTLKADQQHHGALREHAARPLLVEGAQRGGDAGAARPVDHMGRTGGERLVGIALPYGAGD